MAQKESSNMAHMFHLQLLVRSSVLTPKPCYLANLCPVILLFRSRCFSRLIKFPVLQDFGWADWKGPCLEFPCQAFKQLQNNDKNMRTKWWLWIGGGKVEIDGEQGSSLQCTGVSDKILWWARDQWLGTGMDGVHVPLFGRTMGDSTASVENDQCPPYNCTC